MKMTQASQLADCFVRNRFYASSVV